MASNVKNLFREPALLIDFAETLVVLLVAFGIGGLTGDDQSYLVAAVIALVGVGKAFATQPFAVSALTDATRAVLVCAAAVFGAGLSADQIAITATAVGTLFTLVARSQITPRQDPVIKVGGAGAGPVAGEAGYAVLGAVGLGIVLLSVILAVLVLLKVVAVSLVVLVVLFVIGIVLLALDGGLRR